MALKDSFGAKTGSNLWNTFDVDYNKYSSPINSFSPNRLSRTFKNNHNWLIYILIIVIFGLFLYFLSLFLNREDPEKK